MAEFLPGLRNEVQEGKKRPVRLYQREVEAGERIFPEDGKKSRKKKYLSIQDGQVSGIAEPVTLQRAVQRLAVRETVLRKTERRRSYPGLPRSGRRCFLLE